VRAPLVFYLGTISQGVPQAVAAVTRRRLSAARFWVLVWCTVELGFDLLQMWLAKHDVRNLWVAYIETPTQTAVALWAFSCWQTRELARLTLRFAIVPFLAAWAALLLAFESTSDFSRVSQPMAILVSLCAAMYTLVVRSIREPGSLARKDWFWASSGMALYFALTVVIAPLSALLAGNDASGLVMAYQARAALTVVAFLLVAVGMACPSET
jgi:hypothetical protein